MKIYLDINYRNFFYSLITFCCFLFYNCQNKKNNEYIYQKINNSVEYINPETAYGDKDFKVCDEENIYNYYNPQRATYSEGKNKLRKFIMSNYEPEDYSDSGYLNILFVINCKGEAGRYKVYENDLDLESQKFNSDLKTQLLNLTMQLKKWNPNFIRNDYRDSYMYISYRIENGKITEILP